MKGKGGGVWGEMDNGRPGKAVESLQKLTEGDAQKAVESVGDEDGYAAWQELHRLFEFRF